MGYEHEAALLHAMVGTRRVARALALMGDARGIHPLQRAYAAGLAAARRPRRARGRAAAWLHHIEGYTVAEVAQIMRCSSFAIEQLLSRSRLRHLPVRRAGYESFARGPRAASRLR